jgi:hypothetical protein
MQVTVSIDNGSSGWPEPLAKLQHAMLNAIYQKHVDNKNNQ